jgi:hypothetical protein
MSENKPKLKPIIERNLKECELDIIGIRTALDPNTFKNVSCPFLIHVKISVEDNKHFKNVFISKLTLPYRFSWMQERALKTKIFMHTCNGDMTEELFLNSPEPSGINIEFSEPKKIAPKDAQLLVDKGARVFSLDENDRLSSLAVYSQKR